MCLDSLVTHETSPLRRGDFVSFLPPSVSGKPNVELMTSELADFLTTFLFHAM